MPKPNPNREILLKLTSKFVRLYDAADESICLAVISYEGAEQLRKDLKKAVDEQRDIERYSAHVRMIKD